MKNLLLFAITLLILAVNTLTAQTVYSTKTGQSYHSENCSHLKKSKIAINLNDAIKKGLKACSVCSPPLLKTGNTSQKVRIGCICKDGTQSKATGSGACSHHGGVDRWLYSQ